MARKLEHVIKSIHNVKFVMHSKYTNKITISNKKIIKKVSKLDKTIII